jgi:murein L,D-transpeptidase YcbB/YkuD
MFSDKQSVYIKTLFVCCVLCLGNISYSALSQPLLTVPDLSEEAFHEKKTPIQLLLNEAGRLQVADIELDKTSLKKVYEHFSYKPLWFSSKSITKLGDNYFKALKGAAEEGLNPDDYGVGALSYRIKNSKKVSADDLLKTDVLLTSMVLKYIRHIKVGREAPQKLDPELFLEARTIDPVSLLLESFSAKDPQQFIISLAPNFPDYKRLKEALKHYRTLVEKDISWEEISLNGPRIMPGVEDYRVPIIRKRLEAEGYIKPLTGFNAKPMRYSKDLQEAMVTFQKHYGVDANAIVGRDTINAMDQQPKDLAEKIMLNMERWRWLNDKLPERHIRVNIAGYYLRAYEGDKVALQIPVIVGEPYHRTPIFETVMTDVIFHPYWYVPRRIAVEHLLPAFKKNPEALKELGYVIMKVGDEGTLVKSENQSPDWNEYSADYFPITLRQDPGIKNALGPIRFSIKNDDSIYLHGSDRPQLFSEDVRSLSAGCVRIKDPLPVAKFVFKGDTEWPESRIEKVYKADVTKNPYVIYKPVKLHKEIPVYLLYFTVWVDDKGDLHFMEDVYGRDEVLQKALR